MTFKPLPDKFLKLFAIFSILFVSTFAQNLKDTLDLNLDFKYTPFKYKSLILPVSLITYGVLGIESDGLKFYNREIREEVKEHVDEKITIDDFSQYTGSVAVFALNSLGIKGNNSTKNKLLVFTNSYVLMGATVLSMKNLINIERPDGSSNNSFPSGHTATAFMGAEFLWQEYHENSIWLGVFGYTVAATTGIYRMLNNRHWVTDVATGAGIGLLSTKIAYWTLPIIKQKLSGMNDKTISFCPVFSKKQTGISLSISF
ncbi:MAG: phosphatase PAP2 family protein [Candidatus Marinimicrobia bacterium]|nr:phosphatase PAP2 family protein [Candidatus Neomarinimicrobiota bacterium]